MCKYYQVGRFSELGSEEFDEFSAFFHLEQAAELCVKEAIFALAKIYLDLPRDLLSNYRPTVEFVYKNNVNSDVCFL
jgi:HEPN domain-containing protein